MIGLGTKGFDGIDEGIHLRWSFDDKLGFPPCFKLYRRESDLKNKYEFPIQDDILPQRLEIPYTHTLHQNDTFKFRLASVTINGEEVKAIQIKHETLDDGTIIKYIHTEGEVAILFSKPVSRIELRFLLEDNSEFKIRVLSEDGNYYPYAIDKNATGLQNISFDAPQTTGLVLGGTAIKLVYLAGWICAEKGNWKQINNHCGCGLPVNQQGTPYMDDVYPPIIGRDLATALCRLGYKTVRESPITAAEFLELKAMLLTMTEEGREVPVGWTLFPDNAEDMKETDEMLEFSKYDFLLAQSLHAFFAKILGLYFVDTDMVNDTYYDYKVTAKWPEWNHRRLDHEIIFDHDTLDTTFFPLHALDEHVVLYAPKKPKIAEAPYSLSRTTLGLDISSENVPVVINFLQPVTEVQIFMVNPDFTAGSLIVVEAYKHLFSAWVDRDDLTLERGMLRLRAPQIDYLKINTSHAVLCRIHYDFDPYPVDLQSYILCGIFKHTHLPLTHPTALTASFLPGGTVTDQEGNITEKPYLAGLRWDVNENPDKELISLAPVMYHIERKIEGGNVTLLTGDSPLFITPLLLENKDLHIPIGWPEDRQYFTEAITLETFHHYRVAALDLFGRQSAFTNYETYEVTEPRPPHPVEVTAQFLNYSTYHAIDDTFSDSTINADDREWLRDNRKNAIVVRWKWPENLQLQASDVEGFHVHFKQGWLNTYTGMVMTDPVGEILTKTSLHLTPKELEKYKIFEEQAEDIPVFKFQISLDVYPPPLPEPIPYIRAERPIIPENAFRLCWLTQGNHSFLILKNDGGPEVSLWALKLEDMPIKDKGFGVAVTPEKEFFINYKNPEQWTDNRIRHQEPKDTREEYTVYIEDPEFPNPLIEASDRNKVRYAQIGVNSYVGEVEGSVSSPATIMAIYREVPATPLAFMPSPEEPIQALKATPANVHGKSSFALRWGKANMGVTNHIFRALDETLFRVDNANRPTRSITNYEDFKTSFPDFDPADVDVLKNIPHESDPVLIGSHYTALTPGQLQILASLPDNENAFTRINEGAIEENDPLYADRITEIPDPVHGTAYTPDPNTLLYVDETLNGQSSNHYFYAIRSVDTNGLQSAISLSTPPVAIPKTTSPPVPVITSISGGENQIIVKWAKNPGAAIAGYLLYRTQDIRKAGDWRRMELIKAHDTDVFTVAVNGNLPTKEFEYMDTSAVARQAYYYGVVAVGLSDEGKWLRSKISKARVGQGYDLTPPDPPIWDEVSRNFNQSNDEVFLRWHSQEKLNCLVKRRPSNSEIFASCSNWMDIGIYNTVEGKWEYEYTDLKALQSDLVYIYRILVIDEAGNITTSMDSSPV